MKASIAKALKPGALVVISRSDTTALTIGKVVRVEKTLVLVVPLGTSRRVKVALDRIARARALGDVSPQVVGVIASHHASGLSVHPKDLGWES